MAYNIFFYLEDDKGEFLGKSELTTLPFIPRIGEHVWLSSGLLANKDKLLEKHDYRLDPLRVNKVMYSKRENGKIVAEIYLSTS